jgi:hypothetical protein
MGVGEGVYGVGWDAGYFFCPVGILRGWGERGM